MCLPNLGRLREDARGPTIRRRRPSERRREGLRVCLCGSELDGDGQPRKLGGLSTSIWLQNAMAFREKLPGARSRAFSRLSTS